MMGGATHADTISADNMPMTPTPTYVPARCLPLISLIRVWMKLGISMVKNPNIEAASTTKRPLNSSTTQG